MLPVGDDRPIPVDVRIIAATLRDPVKLEELDDADRELRARLIELFTTHQGNVFVVAEALGKQRAQIYKWVKRLSIDPSTFRR